MAVSLTVYEVFSVKV